LTRVTCDGLMVSECIVRGSVATTTYLRTRLPEPGSTAFLAKSGLVRCGRRSEVILRGPDRGLELAAQPVDVLRQLTQAREHLGFSGEGRFPLSHGDHPNVATEL
jgi:hypothetical protein